MKETFELRIETDGSIEGVYQDGLAQALGAEETQVCRASTVEWEKKDDVVHGWVVRSAHDPSLVIGLASDGSYCVTRSGSVVYFAKREYALEQEVKLFWQLLGKDPVKCTPENPCHPKCKVGQEEELKTCVTCHQDYATIGDQCRTCWKTTP